MGGRVDALPSSVFKRVLRGENSVTSPVIHRGHCYDNEIILELRGGGASFKMWLEGIISYFQCLNWEGPVCQHLNLVEGQKCAFHERCGTQRRSIRLILTGLSGTIRIFWYISSGSW